MNDKSILYIVATQYDNMGDLLINKCLIDLLSVNRIVYLDCKNVPEDFKNILLESKNVKEFSTISKFSLKGLGLIFIPFSNFGFSHIFKSPGPFGGAKNLNDKIRYLLFYFIYKTFHLKHTEPVLIGNDLIIDSAFDKWFWNRLSSFMSNIYVRSHLNLKVFSDNGIRASYSPDMCFLLSNASKVRKMEKNKICISFRDLNESIYERELIESLQIAINYYSLLNYSIEFFYQVSRDKDFNKKLYNLFANNSNIIFRDEVLTWSERDYYSEFDFVISNRLHVLLLAQCNGVIPIGLINNNVKTNKISNIYSSIGMDNHIFYSINTDDLDSFVINKNLIREQIISINKIQHDLIIDNIDYILS
ncbi:polysaccharide pyruvyl transferase family protein [uncultured Algoriphagus sp.]|uniref:polysaccharide pyruvyl transferase family protein n=1 Tax=uncultured Algoriphagus sp. TaxID=417365 RepID=UPI0030EEAB55|tara:strand:- start:7518 stop:8600 length:1083 start_codon:yes stop_codon:yes gene_type:complete